MTLGEIIRELERARPDLDVYFDFAQCVPDGIASWRGIYAEPALGWAATGYSGNGRQKRPTVADVLAQLREPLEPQSHYEGWKGGSYSYSEGSPVHVDNPGDCTYTVIDRIDILEDRVVLRTRFEN